MIAPGSQLSLASTNLGDERAETAILYNSLGLPYQITSKAAGVTDRIVKTEYDSFGFIRRNSNQLGHSTESIVNPASGQVVWSRDMNGNIARNTLDRFFRVIETKVPTGSDTFVVGVTNFAFGGSAYAPRQTSVESRFVTGQGSILATLSSSLTRLDRLGRPVFEESKNSNGQMVKSATTFDYLGRPIAQELPAVTQGAFGKVIKTYDELDRVESSKGADLTVTTFTYLSSVGRVFDPEGRLSETVHDNLGRVRATRVKTGSTTSGAMTFNYRSDGALVKSTDSEGNSATIGYDALGRRTSMNDLSAGLTTTAYNGFGEERLITDARGAKATFVRDILGRILERKVADVADINTGAVARDRRTTIVWDTAANGVGQINTSVSSDAVSKAFAYDDFGRLSAETTVKDGYDYSITRKYDGWGRLSVLGYPEARPTATRKSPGTGVATSVEYLYNSTDGSLYGIRNSVSPWNYYWTAEVRDDLDRLKQRRFGNGVVTTQSWDGKRGWLTSQTTSKDANVYQQATYTYSPVGNMKTRTDDAATGGSFRESFRYDALNRLEWWCLRDIAGGSQNCGQAQQGVSYTFSDNGNLKQRKVVQGAQTLEQVAYAYPAGGAAATKPHAVSSRSWVVGSGQAANFAYDGSGRQWQRPGQVVTYNAENLPEKIVQGTTKVAFEYDSGGSRFRKTSTVGTTFSRSTTYVGGIYELREETNLPPMHVFYVSGESGVVAQITRSGSDTGALGGTNVDYLHSDHLGSVSFSTNATGGVGTKVKYDPYGNRFNLAAAPRLDAVMPAGLGSVRLGYTGHEMEVDDLGLINMRGRMFDPVNARFLSPDPLISAANFSQSWNRYMYVMGNPLSFTDPSGFDPTYFDQNYADIYGYGKPDFDQKSEEMAAVADEVANMIIPGESGDASVFNAARAWVQSGGQSGTTLSQGLNAQGSSSVLFLSNVPLTISVFEDGKFVMKEIYGLDELLSFEHDGVPAPSAMWDNWRGATSPQSTGQNGGRSGGGARNPSLREQAEFALNTIGFVADKASGLANAATETRFAIDSQFLLSGSQELKLFKTIGRYAVPVGVISDFYSIGSSIQQGKIPISGSVGMLALGMGFLFSPEVGLFVGAVGAVGSFMIEDPHMPLGSNRPYLFPGY